MYSNKPDYGQKRHYSSRDLRSWDEEPRREERREPQRNPTRDVYDKYSSEGHQKTDRLSSREYGESHKRLHSPDSKRDYRRKSPVKKRTPDRIVSEKRRWTFPEEDHYQYEPEKTYRQSPEQYPQRNKDFQRTMLSEEGYSQGRTPEDLRYQHEQDEVQYSKYEEEPKYRHAAEYYSDQKRSRDQSQERRQSHELTIKDYSAPSKSSGSFSRDFEDHNQNRTRFSLNGSSQQTGEPRYRRQSRPPAAAGEKKMSKGFQRFLDVLNMGVNVDTLTRIVTQGTPDTNAHPQSPPPSPNAADRTWSSQFTQRREESRHKNPQITQHWPETERTERKASPRLSLYGSNGNTISEQRTVESGYFEKRVLSQDSESISQSSLVKSNVRPEEEHKHRQMQDVLQAIGINLNNEELGQMSGRIQERLYGKKQSNSTPNQREEMPHRRAAYYSRNCSRSSSRSSSSSSYQDKKSQSDQRDDWDFSQSDERGTWQQYEKTEMHRNERPAVLQSYQREERDFAQYDIRGTQQSSSMPLRYEKTEMHTKQVISPVTNIQPNFKPPPVIPTNHMPYPPLPPNLPNMFMHQVPPFLPYPQAPPIAPVNMFPPMVPPSGPVLTPHLPFPPRPALPSLPVYQPGPVNTNIQKTNKTANRPRCLQVISTKNPG